MLARALRSPEVVTVASDGDWEPEPAELRDDEQDEEDTHAERIAEQLRMLDDEDSEEQT
jgi:hypothetical protein